MKIKESKFYWSSHGLSKYSWVNWLEILKHSHHEEITMKWRWRQMVKTSAQNVHPETPEDQNGQSGNQSGENGRQKIKENSARIQICWPDTRSAQTYHSLQFTCCWMQSLLQRKYFRNPLKFSPNCIYPKLASVKRTYFEGVQYFWIVS